MATGASGSPVARKLRLRDFVGVLSPRTPPFVDLYQDHDDYHRHVETGKVERARLVAPWIQEESSVLDVGCGDGQIAEFLAAERKVSVRGIEVSEVAASKARRRGIDVVVQDLEVDARLPGPVDYVLFVEVLEHLRAPHLVLRGGASIARKGVVVTIPNSAWWADRVQMMMGIVPRQSFTHLHAWSHRDFLAFCEQLGLRVREASFLASGTVWRRALINAFPNLFARQLAYLIAPSRPPMEE